ncbi:hypothetical protein LSAT2_004736 [Lamellibrachia satsuma]|nr:hypothetical protein LSAT2_004736 [Lamellibrachia satsuma]
MDTIQLFFQSEQRSGGGTVDSVMFDIVTKVAYVTFQSPEVAERVLSKPDLCLDGAKLTVKLTASPSVDPSSLVGRQWTRRRWSDVSGPVVDGRTSVDPSSLVGRDLEHGDDHSLVTNVSSGESAPPMEHKETPNSSITTPEDVRTVEIRGFLPRTSKKIVVMFVENESENEPESCIYDEQNGVAVVTFPNTEGAAKLLNGDQLQLGGAGLTVTPLSDVTAGLDSCRPLAIQVRGISKHTTKKHMLKFAEKSGGGAVEKLEYDNDRGVAVITYKKADSE